MLSEKLPNCGWDQFMKFKKGKYGFFKSKHISVHEHSKDK